MKRALFLILLPAVLFADGGKLILRATDHGETINLFADPYPVRAGQPCDFSVLVQRGDTPVLDGTVSLRVGSMAVLASRSAAINKLLFAADLTISRPGTYPVTVEHGQAHITGQLDVAEGTPAVFSYWPYFAVIPLCIGLFALNRYLKLLKTRSPHSYRRSPTPPKN